MPSELIERAARIFRARISFAAPVYLSSDNLTRLRPRESTLSIGCRTVLGTRHVGLYGVALGSYSISPKWWLPRSSPCLIFKRGADSICDSPGEDRGGHSRYLYWKISIS